jgi:hypothetical protein
VKTSEARLEFSYDSQNRAEVALERGNIVDFGASVSTDVGHAEPLFLSTEQYAAPQLGWRFWSEQTQGPLRR